MQNILYSQGAPGDMRIVEGSMIKNIEKSFLLLEGTEVDVYIPYHRITRIDFNDHIIFERPLDHYLKENNEF